MSVRKQQGSFWKSGTISFLSMLSFATVLMIILAGNIYMNTEIENEAQAQRNRYELKALGESLANASDYLTDEVRKYAITGEVEHLYNYWYEVQVTQQRDTVINTLIGYHPPETELNLLEEAKKYSDSLINTEAYSMKMVLLANGKTEQDYTENPLTYEYVRNVLSYELPEEYTSLSPEQMKSISVHILYDESYENMKSMIMTPIETFQNEMNLRLNNAVADSTAGRVRASATQITCLLTGIVLIGLLLLGLNVLYIHPLKEYTEFLAKAGRQDGFSKFDFNRVYVVPKGAYELKEFGNFFNSLSQLLRQEFENRERAEEAMRMARDEANRANNAKSEFLARMSHELRTPLNAIIGYLYLLNEGLADDRLKHYCQNIRLSSENLLSLINDILDFAKIESGNIAFENTDFNLISLLREVCSVMENSASQKKLYFRLNISGDLPKIVQGDPMKLRQLLMNLIGNAVKFTQTGGIILDVVLLENQENTYRFAFSVKDTGIGIREEDRKKIFEPFVQSDAGITRKYGGTGLGLAICRMIVEEASHGRETLELESVPGQGSTFRFKIDFGVGDEKAAESQAGEPSGIIIEGGKKLLLVDDNEINLEVESEIIRGCGVDVVTAQSGAEALRLAAEELFDMIIMDIRMPDMDGYEATARIRKMQDYKCVPIIALSADVATGVTEKALEAGVNHYAAKPLKPEKLQELMREYFELAQRSPEQLCTESEGYFQSRKCLRNLNGNEEILLRLAEKFIRFHAKDADHIRQHLLAKSYGNALHMLHDVIGLVGNLCCDTLFAASRRLHEELKVGSLAAQEDFFEIWDKTLEEIQAYIKKRKNQSPQAAGDIPPEELMRSFQEHCLAFDVEAVEIFETNQALFQKMLTAEKFVVVQSAVQKYDFESLNRLLFPQRR